MIHDDARIGGEAGSVESSTLTLNDGVEIPRLGFGVFQVPPARTAAVTSLAVESGFRMIDTAAVYDNEHEVGRAIEESGIAPEDVFVITKVWNDDQGYDETLRAFDASVSRLGLDLVDLYMIHWPRPRLDRYLDSWRALVRLRDEGRVRSIGVSNFEAEHIDRLVDTTGEAPSVNQIELHPGFPQLAMREYHASRGVATQAWSPLGRGQGFLSHPVITSIAEAHNRTPAQVVLRWHLQLGVIPLPRSVTPERIRDNVDVFDFRLDDAEVDKIIEIGDGFKVGPDPSMFFDVS